MCVWMTSLSARNVPLNSKLKTLITSHDLEKYGTKLIVWLLFVVVDGNQALYVLLTAEDFNVVFSGRSALPEALSSYVPL